MDTKTDYSPESASMSPNVNVKFSKKKLKAKQALLTCNFCDLKFKVASDFQDHLNWHVMLCGTSNCKSQNEMDNIALKEYFRTHDIDSITCEILDRKFKLHKPYLENIMDGKIYCLRHFNFIQSNGIVQYADVCLVLNEHNSKYICRMMGEMFCSSDMEYIKKLGYFLKVLLPEFLIKLFMDIYDITYNESFDKLININLKISALLHKKYGRL
jgi:hypothetical protein